ncbi:MAG: dialkylresorcinol condensing enzyme, partial [Porticoccaceae bacterium]|nr:dialkylresorcinol condensing enzyme [Porticoccaceae bacterium]
MKKILVIHYSQSGQLSRVVEHFTQPLIDSPDISVTFENILPQDDYPFPWPFFRFLDTFPEAVYLDPPPMQASSLQGDEDFDLIILAYQVWFLSPSLPTTGFLKSPLAASLLKDKPLITLIACRDMWLMAQEEMKKLLTGLDAHLIGNVALVDEAGSIGSFLATPAWVLSGNKGPNLGGLIPRAGVSDNDIVCCQRFGRRIVDTWARHEPLGRDLLQGLSAVRVNETLIASEKTARRAFLLWGKLLRSLGPSGSIKRKPVLLIYVVFLST